MGSGFIRYREEHRMLSESTILPKWLTTAMHINPKFLGVNFDRRITFGVHAKIEPTLRRCPLVAVLVPYE